MSIFGGIARVKAAGMQGAYEAQLQARLMQQQDADRQTAAEDRQNALEDRLLKRRAQELDIQKAQRDLDHPPPTALEELEAELKLRQRLEAPTRTDTNTRQDFAAVGSQIDDTRADMSALGKRPAAGDQQYDDDAALAAAQVGYDDRRNPLQTRLDSLGGVRDSIGGVMQGRRPGPTRPPPPVASGGVTIRGGGQTPAGAPPLLSVVPSSSTPDTDDRAAWAAANPPNAGETREQYRARYEASRHR